MLLIKTQTFSPFTQTVGKLCQLLCHVKSLGFLLVGKIDFTQKTHKSKIIYKTKIKIETFLTF